MTHDPLPPHLRHCWTLWTRANRKPGHWYLKCADPSRREVEAFGMAHRCEWVMLAPGERPAGMGRHCHRKKA